MRHARRRASVAPAAVPPRLLPATRRHCRAVVGSAAVGAVLGLDPADRWRRAHVVVLGRRLPLLVESAVLNMSAFTEVEALCNAQRDTKTLDILRIRVHNKRTSLGNPLPVITTEARIKQEKGGSS